MQYLLSIYIYKTLPLKLLFDLNEYLVYLSSNFTNIKINNMDLIEYLFNTDVLFIYWSKERAKSPNYVSINLFVQIYFYLTNF